MKVNELIEMLQDCDPDADVILGIQPSYPFEHRLRGVVQRRDFVEYDADEEENEASDSDMYRDSFSTSGKPNDVILCEGGQIRYGSKGMFEAC
jgi:hypothetical protein